MEHSPLLTLERAHSVNAYHMGKCVVNDINILHVSSHIIRDPGMCHIMKASNALIIPCAAANNAPDKYHRVLTPLLGIDGDNGLLSVPTGGGCEACVLAIPDPRRTNDEISLPTLVVGVVVGG